MKWKIGSGILFCISIFLIFSGSSTQFITSLKKDRNETLAIQQNINISYEKITYDMENMHKKMVEMQNFFSLYYENVNENQIYYQNIFTEIDIMKKGIENQLEELEDNCKKIVNEESKEKCKSLEINRKTVEESYVNLHQTYQSFIQEHNKWLEQNKTFAMK